MQRIFLAILALGLGACSRPEAGYPPQYELNFMRACQAAGTSTAVCACTWEKIEAEVPRAEFDRFERLPAAERSASPVQRQIEGYALACASAPPPKP